MKNQNKNSKMKKLWKKLKKDGLLNYQIMCRGAGVGVLADYAEKYNFDLSAVKTMFGCSPADC